MFGAIILLCVSIAAILLGYYGIRKNINWFSLTKNGNEKAKADDGKVVPRLSGAAMLVFGVFVFLVFVRSLYRYITHN